ncbi:MAG: threonine dehydratase [Acidobacteriota bacterium]
MMFPTLADVYEARARIRDIITPTPLLRHPLLVEATGLDIWVKHENHNPTSAFKVRGGLNLIRSLSADERRRGVVTASTGNHGQSIAVASQLEDVSCTVFVPDGNNPEKNAAMRALGARVEEGGRDFDDARERCERAAASRGARYVHSANEPLLIAGVATYALEVFEQRQDVDVLLVPIGGGSGACGLCLVRTAVGSSAHVIGVQAAAADAFTRSFRSGARVVGESADTFAEGMATRVTFDLTFCYLLQELNEIVTVTERELAAGVRLALGATHNLAEGAGAAALAAAMQLGRQLEGRRVVAVMSGGNLDAAKLKMVLSGFDAPA